MRIPRSAGSGNDLLHDGAAAQQRDDAKDGNARAASNGARQAEASRVGGPTIGTVAAVRAGVNRNQTGWTDACAERRAVAIASKLLSRPTTALTRAPADVLDDVSTAEPALVSE